MSKTAEILNIISRCLNYIVAIPMIIFGMIGAVLTILIFLRQRTFWRNSTITYLLAGSILTLIHLPTIYFSIVLADGFNIIIYNNNDIICCCFYYFFYVTTVSPIYFACLAAFDQYASTSRRAEFRHRWNSIRFVRLVICGTILFWVILYLPVLFITRRVNGICLITIYEYRILNNYVLIPLFFTIIPAISILIFIRGTIENLREIRIINKQGRLQKQIRRMLIPRLIILFIAIFPFGIESVYSRATSAINKTDIRLAWERFIIQIFRLLFHVDFVGTFYIYFYMSSEVRRAFRQLYSQNNY
ncbi:hypothetical protein I4U23_016237 [Adineta vaga]|nr:hypothetical protein I4U23_016237 [Adineta vaga]